MDVIAPHFLCKSDLGDDELHCVFYSLELCDDVILERRIIYITGLVLEAPLMCQGQNNFRFLLCFSRTILSEHSLSPRVCTRCITLASVFG